MFHEGTEMEPLVIESTSPPSALSPPRSIEPSHSPPLDTLVNEDDGLMNTEADEQKAHEQKQRSQKKWLMISVLSLLVALVFIFVYIFSFNYDDRYPTGGLVDAPCYTPFGTNLGQDLNQVIGYSNCNEDIVSDLPNYLSSNGTNGSDEGEDGQGIYTGMRWQCVEYSRRWLILSKQVTYESIEYAYQIWDLSEVVSTEDPLIKYPFTSHGSGTSLTPPEIGCLLIYNATDYLEPTGHVAVIVGVDEGVIQIGEQNWSNELWLGENYARNLTVSMLSGRYAVEDDYVIGWKCVESR
jgi:hypothetical protein